MKISAIAAASLFALSLTGQAFAQNANQPQQPTQDDKKPGAVVVAPDAAAGAATGGVSGAVVGGVVAVTATAIAIGVGKNNGSKHTDHGTGGTGTSAH